MRKRQTAPPPLPARPPTCQRQSGCPEVVLNTALQPSSDCAELQGSVVTWHQPPPSELPPPPPPVCQVQPVVEVHSSALFWSQQGL